MITFKKENVFIEIWNSIVLIWCIFNSVYWGIFNSIYLEIVTSKIGTIQSIITLRKEWPLSNLYLPYMAHFALSHNWFLQAFYKFTFTYLRGTCNLILEGTHRIYIFWKDALVYECLGLYTFLNSQSSKNNTNGESWKKIKCLK